MMPNSIPQNPEQPVRFRLYIVDATTKSVAAYRNLKALCEQRFPGGYEIELVDLQENPGLAKQDNVVAVPTVVKVEPKPEKRVVGDLSNTERASHGLSLG